MNSEAVKQIEKLQDECAKREENLEWSRALEVAMHEMRLLLCLQKEAENETESAEMAECLFRVGRIHYNMNNYVLAKLYLDLAIPKFIKLEMRINLANCYEYACQIALHNNNTDEALKVCNLAIDAILIHRQKETNLNYRQMLLKRVGGFYLNMGRIREMRGEIMVAISDYRLGLDKEQPWSGPKHAALIKHVGDLYQQCYLTDDAKRCYAVAEIINR